MLRDYYRKNTYISFKADFFSQTLAFLCSYDAHETLSSYVCTSVIGEIVLCQERQILSVL